MNPVPRWTTFRTRRRPANIGERPIPGPCDNRFGRDAIRRVAATVAAGLLLLLASGCAAAPYQPTGFDRDPEPAGLARDTRPTRRPEPVASPPPISQSQNRIANKSVDPQPRPQDPGAEKLVASIGEGITAWRGLDAPGEPIVRVGPIRNQSHATFGELDALCRRLTELLDRSGKRAEPRLHFVMGEQVAAAFEVRGTAYLNTRGGFDQWELYLTVRPAGTGTTVWQADGPIHVLRQARPGSQQIFP